MMKSHILNWHLEHQRVLLRIDANVPLDNGIIINDQRLLASISTLNVLLDKGAQVVVLTHLGRPEDHEPELSTNILLPWFVHAGYDIVLAQTITQAHQALEQGSQLVLLENLRFFKGEQERDLLFAQQLATLGTYYVNDAFGTLHREDSSITLLAAQFDAQHKSIGLLVEHELYMLNNITKLMNSKSCIAIIGGGKVHDKIPLIEQLLPKLSALLLGPGLCFTFLKAAGNAVGRSFIDTTHIDLCKEIILRADQLNIPILYPFDYIVAQNGYDGALDLIDTKHIPMHDVGVSIGPKTAQRWSTYIMNAKTIIVNGLMGSLQRPETLTYVQELYKAVALSDATSVVAGGDSAAAAYYFKTAQDISYLSTGGGATLQYIAGQPLAGLEALKNGTKT